ncbi:MAG: hypothetical protein WBC91_02310 [Phototrophicaceae bacterium]
MDKLATFNDYLPRYDFPRFLRLSCGCLALFLFVSGLFIFLVVPRIFAYIVTFDEYPPLEIQLGETLSLEDFAITLISIENDSRCLDSASCSIRGSVDLIFSTSLDDRNYRVTYIEGTVASDPISMPLGYLLRVMAVQTITDDLVQFHVFQLPTSYTNMQ